MAIKHSTTTDIFIKNKFSKFLTTIGNEQLIKTLSGSTSNNRPNKKDYFDKKNQIIGGDNGLSLSKLAELLQSIGSSASGKFISEILSECANVEGIENFIKITYVKPTELSYEPKNIGILNDFNLYNILNDVVASNKNKGSINTKDDSKTQNELDNNQFFNKIDQNKSDKNTKIYKHEKNNPGLSVIQVIDPELRSCFRNSQEIDLFFNMISTMDISTSIPYVKAEFLVPESVSNKDIKGGNNTVESAKQYLVATMNNFFDGEVEKDKIVSKYTDIARRINGDGDLNEYTTAVRRGVASQNDNPETTTTTYRRRLLNTSLFFSPQTMTNGDYNIDQDKYALIDKFRPFMSIMNLSFDVRPTKGLLFYKTGQLELMLYDKARMNQVAPFIKPELLNTVASEIILEYGWQNNSGDPTYTRNEADLNPIGEFINTLKVREKYIIVNSSYNINENGTVGISLSLAMKGPAELRGLAFTKSSEISELNNSINQIMKELSSAVNDSEIGSSGEKTYQSVHTKLTQIQSDNEITTSELQELLKEVENDRTKNKSRLTGAKYTELKNVITKLIAKKNELNNQEEKLLNDFKFLYTQDDPFLTEDGLKIVASDEAQQIINYKPIGRNIPELTLTSDTAATANEYISLGKIISGIISMGLLPKKNYDEVQLIFYNLNGKAGKASFLNIASVPVHKKRFEEFLSKFIKSSVKTSIEGLVNAVLKYCVNEKAADIYGLRRFYKFNKNNTSEFRLSQEDITGLTLKETDTAEDVAGKIDAEARKNQFANREVQVKNTLFVQYYGAEEFNTVSKNAMQTGTTTADPNQNSQGLLSDMLMGMYDLTFNIPNVVFAFDSTSNQNDKNTNILRIHVYDDKDNPYESLTEILTQYHSGIYDKAISSINLYRSLKQRVQFAVKNPPSQPVTSTENKKEIKNKQKSKTPATPTNDVAQNQVKANEIARITTLENYDKRSSEELITKLILDNILILKDEKGQILPANTDIKDKKIRSISINATRQQQQFKTFKQLKNNFKSYMPSLTLGQSNSALLSGNITTSQDPKYSTVQMMRSMQDVKDPPASDIEYELFNNSTSAPMYVIPSQASATIIGCPLINFSQLIFLDFNTGTSIDNMYFVNGIKHTISPGKFTTDLTLIQSDLYSRFEAHANNIAQFIKSLRESNDFYAEARKNLEKIRKDTTAKIEQSGTTQTQQQTQTQANRIATYSLKFKLNLEKQ